MKAKTLLELLNLSTSVYMITKDEKLMQQLSEMAEKGKKKVVDIMENLNTSTGNGAEGESDTLVQKIVQKAKEAREDLEEKMAEIAERVYSKMKIAHADQVTKLEQEIDSLRRELSLSEARIINLEQNKA
jgi:polyhydroxyalkanoate synthesis regulator phasin